jgi:hypothetical protein
MCCPSNLITGHHAELRAKKRSEAEMSALFAAEQKPTDTLVAKSPSGDLLGAFDGANDHALGYCHPQ